jgi:hypothetical protein
VLTVVLAVVLAVVLTFPHHGKRPERSEVQRLLNASALKTVPRIQVGDDFPMSFVPEAGF